MNYKSHIARDTAEFPPVLAVVDLFRRLERGEIISVKDYVIHEQCSRQTFYNRINVLSLRYPIYGDKGKYRMLLDSLDKEAGFSGKDRTYDAENF